MEASASRQMTTLNRAKEPFDTSTSTSGQGLENGDQDKSQEEPICPSHTSEKALLWRLDRRLVPVLIMLYLMAFLDR